MQPMYDPDMSMNPCRSCPYIMQGQCPYMGAQGMDLPYGVPAQYPVMPQAEMKREDVDEDWGEGTGSEDDEYRQFHFGGRPIIRPRPFFFHRPYYYPRPFFYPPAYYPPYLPIILYI